MVLDRHPTTTRSVSQDLLDSATPNDPHRRRKRSKGGYLDLNPETEDNRAVRLQVVAGPRNQQNQGLPGHPREPLVLSYNGDATSRRPPGMERGRSAMTALRILVDEIDTDIKNAEGEPAHCALTFATAAALEHLRSGDRPLDRGGARAQAPRPTGTRHVRHGNRVQTAKVQVPCHGQAAGRTIKRE